MLLHEERSPTDTVGKVLKTLYAKLAASGSTLSVGGDQVDPADISNPDALLPVFIFETEKVYRYVNPKSDMGVLFRDEPSSFLGKTVDLDASPHATSEIVCYAVEAFLDIYQNTPRNEQNFVPIDSKIEEFREKFHLQAVTTPPVF